MPAAAGMAAAWPLCLRAGRARLRPRDAVGPVLRDAALRPRCTQPRPRRNRSPRCCVTPRSRAVRGVDRPFRPRVAERGRRFGARSRTLVRVTDVEERISELREQVAHHNRLYHELDAPELPDGDYDALVRELRSLEAEYPGVRGRDSPSQAVGGAASATFAPVDPRRADDEPRQRDGCRRAAGVGRPGRAWARRGRCRGSSPS